MTKPILNIGLVGTQFMGKAHSNAYKKLSSFPDAEVLASLHSVCGRNVERMERLTELYGWKNKETDYKKLVQSDEIDLVDISTSNDMHLPIAKAAAEAGKNILCEKPIARNAEEAIEMYQLVEKKSVIHMMIFNYRFVPAIALAKKMIDEGKLGEIRHFNAVYYQDWLVDPQFPFVWRHSVETSGSGAHGDMNAHIVDLARYLVGEFEAVSGDQKVFIKERPIEGTDEIGEVTADDTTSFLARFTNGAIGSFCATRFATGRKNFMRLEIFGSKGSVNFNLERMNELNYFDNEQQSDYQGFTNILATENIHPYIKNWWPPGHIIGWEHTFVHQIAYLLDSIHKNEKVTPDFYDGAKCQLVLDAVSQSAGSRKWVTIQELNRIS